MTQISDLFTVEELDVALEEGYVRSQVHPVWRQLHILNYTEKAQYDRVWTPVTRQCRGLIWDVRTGEVIARPFEKFFNWGEPEDPDLDLAARVTVTDKLDGSLGILFPTPDGQYAVATRGSFCSEQAVHATKLWEERYAYQFTPPPGITMLFEIVYPANRIVCQYGDTDDLFLLGAVENATGITFDPGESEAFGSWPGPVVDTFHYDTLADSVAAEPRPGKEGLVIRPWFTDTRIKIKQADYVALHRILTGCAARRLWEHLAVNACLPAEDEFLVRRLFLSPRRVGEIRAAGQDWLTPLVESVPDEFHEWVVGHVTRMISAVKLRRDQLRTVFGVLRYESGVTWEQNPTREESSRFAAHARASGGKDFHLMMALWRRHEIESTLWREIMPEHEAPFRRVDEAVS